MNTIVYKQWTANMGEEHYAVANLGDNGMEKFYKVVDGPYGNPIIIVEPTLAFPVPEALIYVNAKGDVVVPNEKIGGIICQEQDGTATHRFSLSNPKAPKFETTSDGILIDGVSWYLACLFSKDKNRIINYDAFYTREKPAQVKVLELSDLNFTQLV